MIALQFSGGGLVFFHKVTVKLELNYEKNFRVPMECMLHCRHQLSCSNEKFLFLKTQIFRDALIQFKKY